MARFSAPLKVLVQDTKTGFFFVDANIWTNDPGTARDFERIFLAIDFCAQFNLLTASVVVLCKRSIFSTRFTPLAGRAECASPQTRLTSSGVSRPRRRNLPHRSTRLV